jgi:predicted permease
MSTILQDLRYALRQLRRSPGFALTVIITMALGIGANATVFGVLDALILRPLNVPQSEQLASLNLVINKTPSIPFNSYPDYRDLRKRNSSFSDMTAYGVGFAALEYQGNTTRNWLYEVSENYFDVLRIKPYLGRFFSPSDAHGPNSMPYVVLGYDFWRSQFNADPAIVGKVILVDKHPFTVVGVGPQGFFGTELFLHADIWLPLLNEEQFSPDNFLETRSEHGLFVMGRLKPGVSFASAAADLDTVGRQLAKENPEDAGLTFPLSKPGLGAGYIRGPSTAFLSVVMALAGLVLIAACANLASLFSARAGDRARELALRLALGSSHLRLLRQLVVESLLISILGGVLGLILGRLLLSALSQWRLSADAPLQVNVNADYSLTFLALALSVACGIFFGLVPALAVWRSNPYEVIKQGNVGGAGRKRLNLRDILLLLQVVLCAVLVTSSLVAVRGLVRSFHADLGFQPDSVTITNFDLKMAGYTDLQAYQFQRRATEAAAQLPGVTSAAFAIHTPMCMDEGSITIWREGTADKRPTSAAAHSIFNEVSPGYLATAQTALLAGRDFTWHDDANAPHVAIVNQTFARSVFGAVNPIGQVFLTRDSSLQVVGVVADGKYENLAEDPKSAVFVPVAQFPGSNTTLIVRSASIAEGPQTGTALARLIHQLDPSVPASSEGWRESLSLALFPSIVATAALGTMGALAAMLALTGIFGMASYAVSRRLRELGIRMALGAARRQVLRAAIGRPVILLSIGSLLGLGFGALASKVLGVVVYQATSRDPLVLVGVVLSMALIGTLAAWLPARRALAVQPSRLLREE